MKAILYKKGGRANASCTEVPDPVLTKDDVLIRVYASCICRPVSGYGGSLYRDAVAYAVLILILLIKPTGLFGEKTGEKI